MISRFEGTDGRQRLLNALRNQQLVLHSLPLARAILRFVKLKQFDPGEFLTRQNASDCDLFFILHGRVSIVVNGREIGVFRESGQHVGEMALLNNSPRSACVKAITPTTVACLCEPDFTKIGNKFPELWRAVAAELSNRLRQRNKFVRNPNLNPKIFIGSSNENFKVAKQVCSALTMPGIEPAIWKSTKVFRPSHTAIESLMAQVETSDFGILVLGADDYVISRKHKKRAPRDNVLFELGLFMGALGRARTMALLPRGIDLKKPSDLLGVCDLFYDTPEKRSFKPSILEAVNDILSVVKDLGPK